MTGGQPDAQWLLGEVISAVSRLSESPDAQLAHVAGLGSPGLADELAQELDDVLDAAIAVPGLLVETEVSALRALDDVLAVMSGPENRQLWTEEAVRESNEWREVRRRAATALGELRRHHHGATRGVGL